jgi:DNA polymerase III epsilon subunit-like protein
MIVLDIETTGLDPELHGLISIGALDMFHPKEQFYGECRIREGEKIDSQALEVNGFTYDEARDKDKQSTRDLLIAFDEWLKSRDIKMIGGLHIAAFDVPFLNKKALQSGVRMRLHRRSIDLHSIAYARMQELGKVVPMTDGWSVMDIDFIPPFCGLPKEPKPHNALNGVKWEAESMYRLMYGKGLLREFSRYPVPNNLKRNLSAQQRLI